MCNPKPENAEEGIKTKQQFPEKPLMMNQLTISIKT